MRKSDIQVGETYANGKEGRLHAERRVLAAGGRFVLYEEQADLDCLQYEVVAGRDKGAVRHCTRTSFAAWARQRVVRLST